MIIAVDTTAVIAVITNEAHKSALVAATRDAELIAPASLGWEVGNAFSAMFKRNRLTIQQAIDALAAYDRIPIRTMPISLGTAVKIASDLGIYAYDAYMIACAKEYNAPLLSLDHGLLHAARRAQVQVLEVTL